MLEAGEIGCSEGLALPVGELGVAGITELKIGLILGPSSPAMSVRFDADSWFGSIFLASTQPLIGKALLKP